MCSGPIEVDGSAAWADAAELRKRVSRPVLTSTAVTVSPVGAAFNRAKSTCSARVPSNGRVS